ncbi:hypothetical protein WAI453_006406 [Rhynchosporium graminicola]
MQAYKYLASCTYWVFPATPQVSSPDWFRKNVLPEKFSMTRDEDGMEVAGEAYNVMQ